MIVTDHFIYIHLHKSGGTFVNECLMRFVPGARQLGYHLPCRLIPEALRGMPVLGFVRNPWDYYVSWYTFQSAMKQGNAVFRCASEENTLDFGATISNLLNLHADPALLDRLLEMLPEAYTHKGLNLPRASLAPIRGSGMGFYTYLYNYMFTGYAGPLTLGRIERLRDDLLKFLDRHGVATPAVRDYVMQETVRNATAHRPYTEYYDTALRDRVAELDAPVIRAFDYTFDP